MKNLRLTAFGKEDFHRLIDWIESEELLVTIAGTKFTFPLTHDQLKEYVNEPDSRSFNVVETYENRVIGHAEIILLKGNRCKLDKILIADKTQRGKGLGTSLLQILLEYCFNILKAEQVELYVYDWNTAGIKCYEKAGFVIEQGKKIETVFNDKKWTALLMTAAINKLTD